MSTIHKTTHEAFYDTLAPIYAEIFKTDKRYAYIASKTTPEELARRMTVDLAANKADKNGAGVKQALKALGIVPTYEAIKTWFDLGTVECEVAKGGSK